MYFPMIWRSKFTDLAKSKKKNSIFGKKTAVDKSAWIKAWHVRYGGNPKPNCFKRQKNYKIKQFV